MSRVLNIKEKLTWIRSESAEGSGGKFQFGGKFKNSNLNFSEGFNFYSIIFDELLNGHKNFLLLLSNNFLNFDKKI